MTDSIKLNDFSAEALTELAKRATTLAAALRAAQPSYTLALEMGVVDLGYNTVRHGWIPSFGGRAAITMADGRRWRAIGHKPRGGAEYISREGYIEFVPLG